MPYEWLWHSFQLFNISNAPHLHRQLRNNYLNVFLSSEYGYQLITHFTYGSVVDEIDDNHVRQIPFPLLKNKAVQDRINALALEANKKRYEAYLLEQQAIEIMNDEVIFAK